MNEVREVSLIQISSLFNISHKKADLYVLLSSMSTDLIKQRITELGILPELTGVGEPASAELSARFVARMYKNIYPLISGMDHDRLVFFYSLLTDCEASDSSSQNHVKLLKKIKSSAASSSS